MTRRSHSALQRPPTSQARTHSRCGRPQQLRVGNTLAPFCDSDGGAIASGSRRRGPPLACQRRHEHDVATQRRAKRSSPVHDKIKAAAIGQLNKISQYHQRSAPEAVSLRPPPEAAPRPLLLLTNEICARGPAWVPHMSASNFRAGAVFHAADCNGIQHLCDVVAIHLQNIE